MASVDRNKCASETTPTSDFTCQRCNGGFIEFMDESSDARPANVAVPRQMSIGEPAPGAPSSFPGVTVADTNPVDTTGGGLTSASFPGFSFGGTANPATGGPTTANTLAADNPAITASAPTTSASFPGFSFPNPHPANTSGGFPGATFSGFNFGAANPANTSGGPAATGFPSFRFGILNPANTSGGPSGAGFHGFTFAPPNPANTSGGPGFPGFSFPNTSSGPSAANPNLANNPFAAINAAVAAAFAAQAAQAQAAQAQAAQAQAAANPAHAPNPVSAGTSADPGFGSFNTNPGSESASADHAAAGSAGPGPGNGLPPQRHAHITIHHISHGPFPGGAAGPNPFEFINQIVASLMGGGMGGNGAGGAGAGNDSSGGGGGTAAGAGNVGPGQQGAINFQFTPLLGGMNGANFGDFVVSAGGLDNVITMLLNQLEGGGPPPAAKDQIEALPIVTIDQHHIEDKLQCHICMEDFVLDENVRSLPCKHLYHDNCIVPWLELHGTCPMCRQRIGPAPPEQPPNNLPPFPPPPNNGPGAPPPIQFHFQFPFIPRPPGPGSNPPSSDIPPD